MEPVDRRSFLKQAGVAAAAAGAVAALPAGIGAAGATTSPRGEHPLSHEEVAATPAVVAHVRNAASGEIAVFVGEREITIHDRSVAARLVRATRTR